MTERKANGLRRSPFIELTDENIASIKKEIRAIEADEKIFVFNEGLYTSYTDSIDQIDVMGDIFPDESSCHPRDIMSIRAVLAHEYYGHRANKGTPLPQGSWADEFRASYMAAKNAPNLTDDDTRHLILDALERAKEAGVNIRQNAFIRRVLYGR
jgi:hypothetical protein